MMRKFSTSALDTNSKHSTHFHFLVSYRSVSIVHRMTTLFCHRWAIVFFLFSAFYAQGEDVYQKPEVFIAESFGGTAPAPQVMWLTKDLQAEAKKILGHKYSSLRVRYWAEGDKSAWILEEIGKVKLITTGIVVESGKIDRLKVLIYRESHGWEVRYPFFTDQFKEVSLNTKNRLSKDIDGISGATLSVNALIRQTRFALFLDQQRINAESRIREKK